MGNYWGRSMFHCPDCDVPLEFDKRSGKYYCPKCHQYWDDSEVERKETISHIYEEHMHPSHE